MGVKVWIRQDSETGDWFMYDNEPHYALLAAGPVEISNELFERIRETERQFDLIQDTLADLVYDWTYPDEDERDCD